MCDHDRACGRGFSCDRHFGLCVALRGEGHYCRRDSQCVRGLSCMFGKCHRSIPNGQEGKKETLRDPQTHLNHIALPRHLVQSDFENLTWKMKKIVCVYQINLTKRGLKQKWCLTTESAESNKSWLEINGCFFYPGARCKVDRDCGPSMCCARHHGEQVCKRRLMRGESCYVPDGGLAFSINQICPCDEGLLCRGNSAPHWRE